MCSLAYVSAYQEMDRLRNSLFSPGCVVTALPGPAHDCCGWVHLVSQAKGTIILCSSSYLSYTKAGVSSSPRTTHGHFLVARISPTHTPLVSSAATDLGPVLQTIHSSTRVQVALSRFVDRIVSSGGPIPPIETEMLFAIEYTWMGTINVENDPLPSLF